MDQVVQSHVANHSFMGSVLVARGNDVIFSKGYGSADLEWDVPNAPNTKFRLGSVTKQFTAACILLRNTCRTRPRRGTKLRSCIC
jgi:CubicO group peptidase (beta-lactamase class C family)